MIWKNRFLIVLLSATILYGCDSNSDMLDGGFNDSDFYENTEPKAPEVIQPQVAAFDDAPEAQAQPTAVQTEPEQPVAEAVAPSQPENNTVQSSASDYDNSKVTPLEIKNPETISSQNEISESVKSIKKVEPKPALKAAPVALKSKVSKPKCEAGESYTLMRSGAYACCPAEGNVCYPVVGADNPAPQKIKKLSCLDDSTPDSNGCCNGEVFTKMKSGLDACCPNDGNECYPPIK